MDKPGQGHIARHSVHDHYHIYHYSGEHDHHHRDLDHHHDHYVTNYDGTYDYHYGLPVYDDNDESVPGGRTVLGVRDDGELDLWANNDSVHGDDPPLPVPDGDRRPELSSPGLDSGDPGAEV